MTLLLLFAALAGVWGSNYVYLWKGNDKNFYKLDDNTQSTSISLEANQTYGFLLTNGNNWDYNPTKWGFHSDEKKEVPFNYKLKRDENNNGAKDGSFQTTVSGEYTFSVTWGSDGLPTIYVKAPTVTSGGKIHYGTLNGNNWDNVTDANLNADGSVSINLTAGNTYAFVYQEGGKTYKFSNNPKIFTKTETDVETKVEGVDNFSGNGQIKASVTGTYTFKVTKTDGRLYMSVTFPDPIDYYITSNGLTEKGNVYDGKYYFSLPASYYDKETGKITFNISKGLNGATTYLTATNTAFSGHNNSEISSVTDGATSPVEFTYTTPSGTKNDEPSGDISVVYDPSNGKLTLSYESAQDIIGYSYYLIVPDANVGTTSSTVEGIAPANHKAFRLKASRERNSTVINNDLTTLALKLDGRQLRYNTNGEIEFYIQSSDGTVYMQPKNNNDDTYIKLARNASNMARNKVDYYATRTGTYSSNQNRYYKIHKNDTNPTDGSVDTKTLVFMFSKGNASKTAHINDYNKNVPISNGNSIDGETTGRDNTGKDLKYNVGKDGNLIVGFLMSRGAGSKYYEDHINKHGLYLVGSIAQKEYTHDKSHPMEKRYWKDGRIVELSDLGNDEAKADSIVYNCLVRNTDRSWDDFFLSFSTGDVVEGTGLWNLLLRPCVQDQMDAQELGGGVTFYQYDGGVKNNGQSLNPLLTAEQKARYVSYRVYFNATYSTYRIEFNDAFYIAGPAVNGSTDSGNSGTSFDKEHRYAMRKVTANGEEHYTYMGYFKKGGSFAFLVNEETTTSNYSEDENALQLEDGNAESAWKVQAPGNGGDYAFYNKVKWNNGTGGTDNESLGTGNKAILWNLPDGYYTIRFYYGGTSGPKSDKTALYTVDKSVKISNVTVNVAETEKNYGGWMPFSDDCALWLPSNIKAYYAYDVKEETDGKKIVQLRELKGGYVPANCGVLLRNEDLTEKGAVERLNYMPVPAGYTKSFEDYKSEQKISDNNLLMDCSTTDKCVELDQVKDGYYNYFFTYKYKDAGKNGGEFFDVPLNFWKVYPGEKPNKNSSYLRVAKQVTPLEFNVTDNNYYIADSEKVANSKGAYCLLFSIDDIDDNETTGIRVISPAADNDTNTDGWYNMQGMRVSKPTTAGIYINNGKKVVIK